MTLPFEGLFSLLLNSLCLEIELLISYRVMIRCYLTKWAGCCVSPAPGDAGIITAGRIFRSTADA